MKGTICALALSLALLGNDCESVEKKQPEGGKRLEIPADCKETKSLYKSDNGWWNLLCADSNGKDIFYHVSYNRNNWHRYDIVRK